MIIVSCLSCHALVATAEETLPASELQLSDIHQQQLQQDAPFVDMFIDSERNIWIAGRTKVWKWSTFEKRLQRIQILNPNEQDVLQKLVPVEDNLLAVASKQALVLISLTPFLVTRFEHPQLAKGTTKNLTVEGSNIIWTHQDGIVRLNAQTREMEALKSAHMPAIQDHELAYFAYKSGKLWLGRAQNILMRDFNTDRRQSKLIYRDNAPIRDLYCQENECFAQTARALLRFQSDGTLAQAIPVANNKSLLAMDIRDQQHIFLFSDGYAQVQDLRERNAFIIDLTTADITKDVSKLRCARSLVAILQPQSVRTFHIPRLRD